MAVYAGGRRFFCPDNLRSAAVLSKLGVGHRCNQRFLNFIIAQSMAEIKTKPQNHLKSDGIMQTGTGSILCLFILLNFR